MPRYVPGALGAHGLIQTESSKPYWGVVTLAEDLRKPGHAAPAAAAVAVTGTLAAAVAVAVPVSGAVAVTPRSA